MDKLTDPDIALSRRSDEYGLLTSVAPYTMTDGQSKRMACRIVDWFHVLNGPRVTAGGETVHLIKLVSPIGNYPVPQPTSSSVPLPCQRSSQ